MTKLDYSTIGQAWARIEPTIRKLPLGQVGPEVRFTVIRDMFYAGALAAIKITVDTLNIDDEELRDKKVRALADELVIHDREVQTRARDAVENLLADLLKGRP